MVMEYFYCEPVKGNVVRFRVVGGDGVSFELDIPGLGSVPVPKEFAPEGCVECALGRLWPETEEWKIRYQDSLSLKVSQRQVSVYMVMPIKRGKFNSRVLVIDSEGVTYHGLVPTVPLPVLGQELHFLKMELTPVSLAPAMDILEKVLEAREG
jgi:hypothetical protein